MLRVILTFCLIFVFCAVGFAQNGDAGKEESKKKVLFKADSEFSAELETPIDAEKAKIGEDINFKLAEDFKGQGEKDLERFSSLRPYHQSAESVRWKRKNLPLSA